MAKKKKAKASPAEIEQLYDTSESRLTQERSDFILPQIWDFVKQKRWINLRPEYQRRLVWDRKKKSLLIESFLMNIPIPPIFLYETDLNRYEVMDGQQRLNTVLEFYENEFVLTGLEKWSVLNGLSYKSCPPRIQRGLDRRRISATVLVAENVKAKGKDDVRREVFERLNADSNSMPKRFGILCILGPLMTCWLSSLVFVSLTRSGEFRRMKTIIVANMSALGSQVTDYLGACRIAKSFCVFLRSGGPHEFAALCVEF